MPATSHDIPKHLHGWASAGKGKHLLSDQLPYTANNGKLSLACRKTLGNIELPLKTFDDDAVDMDISHCGICGSDIHTIGKQQKIVALNHY